MNKVGSSLEQSPTIIMNHYQSSYIIINHHQSSSIIANHHHYQLYNHQQLSSNINHYHSSPSSILINHYQSSLTIIKHHKSFSIIIIHELPSLILTLSKFHYLIPKIYKFSFILRTCNVWSVLLSSFFPGCYNLPSFKSKINKLDLMSLSS